MLQSPSISSFVEKDSIMKQFFSDDFFKDDIFSNSTPLGIPNMHDMMKQMEAMRQQFFSDNNRYLIPPEKKDNNKNRSKIIEKKQV